jgi:hypothetical protein
MNECTCCDTLNLRSRKVLAHLLKRFLRWRSFSYIHLAYSRLYVMIHSIERDGPWPQGKDDPAQGRHCRLAPVPGRRLRRAADRGRGPRDGGHVFPVVSGSNIQGARERLEQNFNEDNGREPGTAGIRIRGEPSGLIFENNVIRDTRSGAQQTQSVGILVEDRVGPVRIGSNKIEAGTAADDRRRSETQSGSPE